MSMNRNNPARDSNERSIVRRLNGVGAMVTRISGAGVPDLLVGWKGQWILMEVKVGNSPLTPQQREWHDAAAFCNLPVYIVRSESEALDALTD